MQQCEFKTTPVGKLPGLGSRTYGSHVLQRRPYSLNPSASLAVTLEVERGNFEKLMMAPQQLERVIDAH